MLKEIEGEQLKLQEDRARMEIAKTLQSKNSDHLGVSRAEIDAAVRYAEVSNPFVISPSIALALSRLKYC